MSLLHERKRKEAEEQMKQATKHLERKTFFRKNPDYLLAAPYLEKAAECYRAANDWDTAKRVFLQAAEVQSKIKASFRAAQCCENAAKISVQQIKDLKGGSTSVKTELLTEMQTAFDKAMAYYADMGELGKAADALVKSAEALALCGVNDGVRELFMRACSMMEAQGKPHFAVDVFRKTLAFLVQNEQFTEAVALLHREVALFSEMAQPNNIYKCNLSEIVLRLALNDVPAADQAYMAFLQSDGFLKSDECALAEDLVRAFKTGNDELLQQTIRKQGFSFLDNQIGRLVRKLSLYGGAAPVGGSASTTRSTAASSYQSTASATPNPFAPSVAAPIPPANEYDLPPAAPIAESVEAPTESMASLTVESEEDHAQTQDFDFDALAFSAKDVAANPEDAIPIDSTPAAPAAQPPAQEDDMFDLT